MLSTFVAGPSRVKCDPEIHQEHEDQNPDSRVVASGPQSRSLGLRISPAAKRLEPAIMRHAEIDRRTLRNDPGWIDRRMTGVIVPLDLCEVDGLRDARDLVQLAQIVPQVR